MSPLDAVANGKHAAMEDLRILVVEDNALVSMDLDGELMEMGCASVLAAGSVRAALAVLDTEQPNLAVLDLMVGGEIVTPVAARLAAAGIPYVVVSGYSPDDIDEDLLFRNVPYLAKPYSHADLNAILLELAADARKGSN